MQFSGFRELNSHLDQIPMTKDNNVMDNTNPIMSKTCVTNYSKFLRHIVYSMILEYFKHILS